MPRAEPCQVPGCLDFKLTRPPFCSSHWRSLPTALRAAIVAAQSVMRQARADNNRELFIRATRLFVKARDAALANICKEEAIHERD